MTKKKPPSSAIGTQKSFAAKSWRRSVRATVHIRDQLKRSCGGHGRRAEADAVAVIGLLGLGEGVGWWGARGEALALGSLALAVVAAHGEVEVLEGRLVGLDPGEAHAVGDQRIDEVGHAARGRRAAPAATPGRFGLGRHGDDAVPRAAAGRAAAGSSASTRTTVRRPVAADELLLACR